MTFLNRPPRDFPFCPGCGHGGTLQALDSAMTRLDLNPARTAIVTDIGCIGLSDQYFNVHAFHGLHGRAVTYASGLKLADPDLTVIAIMGDGGCGIGGTHLVNAARRNVGITLVVCNNFNFGMTGGQHSVTTPCGGITATTTEGNPETPLDLCALVSAGSAPFVARTTVYDQALPDLLAKAIAHPGFSLVDVWEICTAYYVQTNRLNAKSLKELMAGLGFASGVIRESPRPEAAHLLRERARVSERAAESGPAALECAAEAAPGGAAAAPPGGAAPAALRGLSCEFPGTLHDRVSIVIAGSAGEKVKSCAAALGTAAILCGGFATQKDDYPITVMTGHSAAEMILSPSRIEFTGIDSPDILLILSQDGLRWASKILARMGPDQTVLADDGLDLPSGRSRVLRFPFRASAAEAGKKSIPMLALGTLLAGRPVVPLEALRRAVALTQKPPVAEVNLKAIEQGAALAGGS
ncbi:MAG: 2-oxoacid:acceptor oxidoreductase family protein [Planctomycetes bacterium]|nr:2-oxoacid:acceptor oxidoreductase family protein [Planctomycetota bacterium]